MQQLILKTSDFHLLSYTIGTMSSLFPELGIIALNNNMYVNTAKPHFLRSTERVIKLATKIWYLPNFLTNLFNKYHHPIYDKVLVIENINGDNKYTLKLYIKSKVIEHMLEVYRFKYGHNVGLKELYLIEHGKNIPHNYRSIGVFKLVLESKNGNLNKFINYIRPMADQFYDSCYIK